MLQIHFRSRPMHPPVNKKSKKPTRVSGPDFSEVLKTLGFTTPGSAAEALGVSRQNVYKWASGVTVPPQSILRLLEMYLKYGVPEQYLPPRA
jgi:DNA-binding transcriptional regulator YiaG